MEVFPGSSNRSMAQGGHGLLHGLGLPGQGMGGVGTLIGVGRRYLRHLVA